MKYTKKQLIFIPILIIACSFVHGQSPQQFSYQAVVRDNNNHLIPNRTIGMRVSILKDSTNGQVAYVETHSPKTNQQGLIQLNIGGGNVVSGSFSSVPWSAAKLFVKTEMDLQGAANYTISNVTQLLSVPYAMYASDIPISKSGDTVKIGKSRLVIPGSQLVWGSAPASLSNGLVGYWPFNGNANDESGNGNHGTVYGAILTNDRFGTNNKAYHFNFNWIIVPGNNFNFTNNMSVNIWYKIDSNTPLNSDNIAFVSKHISGSFEGSSYTLYNDNRCGPTVYITQADLKVNKINNLSFCDTTKWHMLTMTVGNNELKMYLDGVYFSKNTVTENIQKSDVPLVFGAFSKWNSSTEFISYLMGKIDDIRIYNRVLTQEEITYLANN